MNGLDPKPFKFKEFSIYHHPEVMKVSTDSVLLASWTDIANDKWILDVGCGCGILSIMAAQRNRDAQITGIDILSSAIELSKFNFNASGFQNDVKFIQQDIRTWTPSQRFDHILCNPPYFEKVTPSKNQYRNTYRHAQGNFLKDFLSWTQEYLADEGKISLILPINRAYDTELLLNNTSLGITNGLKISHQESKQASLIIYEIRKIDKEQLTGNLSIETLVLYDGNGQRTTDYELLCEDYYL